MPDHLIPNAVEHVRDAARTRQAYVNAHSRIVNQVRSLCRSTCGREGMSKEQVVAAADVLYEAFRKQTDHPLRRQFEAGYGAFKPILERLEEVIDACEYGSLLPPEPGKKRWRRAENGLVHAVRTLDPKIYEWAMRQKGLGEIGVGNIIMVTHDLARYRTVSRLWFWCGLGLVTYADETRERQRNYKDKEKAALHRYVSARRKEFYLIATNFIRAGNPRYRAVYDRAKEHFITQGKSKKHAHLHGLRIVAKRFLADFWEVWNPEWVVRRPNEMADDAPLRAMLRRQADRIDGYDRDDLGESPDF